MSDENEIPPDLLNDIRLTFDLYKNEKEKISKLKLRTLLFSFCMYKSSASDINEYIESETDPDKEEFDFDIVCILVNQKLKSAKNKDADEIFNYMIANKSDKNDTDNLKSEDFSKAFKKYGIDASDAEIREMMKYMTSNKKKDEDSEQEEEEEENEEDIPEKINKVQFKKFYTSDK